MWTNNFQTLSKNNDFLSINWKVSKWHNLRIEYYIFQFVLYSLSEASSPQDFHLQLNWSYLRVVEVTGGVFANISIIFVCMTNNVFFIEWSNWNILFLLVDRYHLVDEIYIFNSILTTSKHLSNSFLNS